MSNISVSLEIMNKKFKVNCSQDEKTKIIDAADMVSKKISEIKKHGKSAGTDRIVIMAALNIANEYLLLQDKIDNTESSNNQQISVLLARVENSLAELKKI